MGFRSMRRRPPTPERTDDAQAARARWQGQGPPRLPNDSAPSSPPRLPALGREGATAVDSRGEAERYEATVAQAFPAKRCAPPPSFELRQPSSSAPPIPTRPTRRFHQYGVALVPSSSLAPQRNRSTAPAESRSGYTPALVQPAGAVKVTTICVHSIPRRAAYGVGSMMSRCPVRSNTAYDAAGPPFDRA